MESLLCSQGDGIHETCILECSKDNLATLNECCQELIQSRIMYTNCSNC